MFYKIEHIPNERTMQAVVAELLPLVPLQRRDKALRYTHLHGRYCCLRAWQLLHELLIKHAFLPAAFPLSALTYTENEYGKPSLNYPYGISRSGEMSIVNCQLSIIHFSLSHTKNAIAVVIDHSPVGIDIEAVVSPTRISDSHFLSRTMNPAEQQQINASANPCLAFTELWTQKEALVKAIGTGLDLCTLPDLLNKTGEYSFCAGHTDTYAYAIAYEAH